jgi:hypothetical protein
MLKASTLTDSRWRSSKPEKQIARRKKAPIKRGQSVAFVIVSATNTDWCNAGETTIDILDDDALLTIFIVYKEVYSSSDLSWWRPLVRVCHRWRRVIFASPLRLNLTIVCTSKTPVNTSLDIWPPFPIAVHYTPREPFGEDENVVDALEHRDRVTDIRFKSLTSFELISFFGTMDRPFSALTYVFLESIDDESFLPSDFLGESAPSLRTLILERIAFPALPTLLLSTTQLVTLWLSSMSTIGYILPEVMASCLVALPNLKHLGLELRPLDVDDMDVEEPSPPLSTRGVLRSLISFCFEGVSEYLEDLLAQIDAPILQTMSATFRDDVTDIPQLLRFTNCAGRLSPPIRAMMEFEFWRVILKFMPLDGFELAIICNQSVRQVWSMALVCRELLPVVSRVERLDLYSKHSSRPPSADFIFWLELFQPFIAVQNLFVSINAWPDVTPLRELIGERTTEVLPELRILFLQNFRPSRGMQESIQSFITARRLSDRPVAIRQCTASDFDPLSFCSWPGRRWHAWVNDRP